jgi:ABC-type branched-subunit amino acid transport system permease subunit
MGALYGPVVGAVFVACVLLFRRGIVGEIAKWAGLAL